MHSDSDTDSLTAENPQCQGCLKQFATEEDLQTHEVCCRLQEPSKADCGKNCNSMYKPLFNCPHCQLTFRQKESVRIHVFRAHKPDDLKRTKLIEDYFPQSNESLPPSAFVEYQPRTDPQCLACSAQFASEGELRAHEPYCTWAAAMKPGKYSCYSCKATASELWYLKLHMRAHVFERPFLCPYCPLDFAARASVKNHIKLFHSGEPGGRWPQSEATSDGKEATERLVALGAVSSGNSAEDEMKLHMALEHQLELKPKAKPPPKVISPADIIETEWLVATIDAPLKAASVLPKRNFICPECNRSFAYLKNYENHVKQCSGHLCASSAGRASAARNRVTQRSISPSEAALPRLETRHPCPLCWTIFDSEEEVRTHMRTHSELRRPDADHRAKTAADKKPFRCLYCDQSFASTEDVRRHVLVLHKGLLPLESPEPRQAVRSNGHRDNSADPADLPIPDDCGRSEDNNTFCAQEPKGIRYQCPHCEKSFLKSWKLEEHMTVHNGKRPFVCWHCALTFKSRHTLKNHMHRAHNSEEAPAEKPQPEIPPPSSSDGLMFYNVYQKGISALDSFISQMPGDVRADPPVEPEASEGEFPEVISSEWYIVPDEARGYSAFSPRIFTNLGARLAQQSFSNSYTRTNDASGMCPHCRKIYKNLLRHLPECGARSASASVDDDSRDYEYPQPSRKGNEQPRSECPYCRRTFQRLRKHMKHCYKLTNEPALDEMGEEGKEMCPYCRKTFVFLSTHLKHCRKLPSEMEDDISEPEKREICQYCQGSYNRVKKHQWYCPQMKEKGAVVGETEKKYHCYFCNAEYCKRQSARQHMRLKHSEELKAKGELLDSPHDSDAEPEPHKEAIRRDIRSLREPRKEELKMNAHGMPVCKNCGQEFIDMPALRAHQKIEKANKGQKTA